MPIVSKPVFKTLVRDFILCIDLTLGLPQTIVVFGRQNTELFGEYISKK